MIAGPNGSGKSTLIQHLRDAGADFGHHLNADEIAKNLSQKVTSESNLAAQQLVRDQRAALLAAGESYSWETVMSHPSHIEHLAEARSSGYDVNLIYVCIEDPVVNIFRVSERVDAGGHFVPKDRILERYEKSLMNLSASIVISHSARIYDNSLAFEPFRLVAEWEDQRLTVVMNPPPNWFKPAIDDLRDEGFC